MNNVLEIDLSEHQGRVFATSDIHGHFDLLNEKMDESSFDTSKDLIVCAGDICDKGPYSGWVLDYLNEPWFLSVRGNHEQMVVDYYESLALNVPEHFNTAARMLYENGGEWYFDLTTKQQGDIYQSFKSLPLGIELEFENFKVGVVHAQVPWSDWGRFKEMSWEDSEAVALWARSKYEYPERFDDNVQGVDWVISGHTPVKGAEPEWIGNQLYLDLGSFFTGRLGFVQIAENGRCLL